MGQYDQYAMVLNIINHHSTTVVPMFAVKMGMKFEIESRFYRYMSIFKFDPFMGMASMFHCNINFNGLV